MKEHFHGVPSKFFQDRFGYPASLIVRTPGRVNLIGEHIDYSLLPVLPMAIQLRTTLTVRPRKDSHVRLVNAKKAYSDIELELSANLETGPTNDWGDYARGAAQALVHEYGITVGADIAVESNLPVAAGLSSSSALSCGVALALLTVNGHTIDRVELAEIMAAAEQYTGTQGGGMDQAVILCARGGSALEVNFAPLQIREVEVPGDWVFLVTYSGIVAEKSGAAQATYNTRTRECREALQTIWGWVGKGIPPKRDYRPLLEAANPQDLLNVADKVLRVPLLPRLRHTVSEALRVPDAEAALRMQDIDAFGRIMNLSHKSLRDDYEVSTPELDRIVILSQQAGAAGARLTGAGLGGAALILCTKDKEQAIRKSLVEEYCSPQGKTLSENDIVSVIPSGGATVARAVGG